MILLVIVMTLGGHDIERREPMPNVEACFARAAETWKEIVKVHPEVLNLGIGCVQADGDPV